MPLKHSAARQLPNGKMISTVGFGCSSAWSKPSFDQEIAQEILAVAVAEGINHFDTGPSYADGEVRLGRFLAGRDPSQLVISTKVGTEPDHARSFDPVRMAASFDASLARLGVDKVDILYLHGPEVSDLTTEVFAFFDRLKAERRIAYSGVNSFEPEVVAACRDTPIDVVMLQYSIADRRFDALIAELAAHGKIVIAGTVLAQGVFDLRTFLPRDRVSLWYLLRALRKDPLFAWHGAMLALRLRRTGLPPHEAALRFAVANPHLTSCLFGTSKAAHVRANAAAARMPLEAAQVAQLAGQSAVLI